MPDQFTVQWAVKYKRLTFEWDHPDQEFVWRYRDPDTSELLTEEGARKWASSKNERWGKDYARVFSRRVTEWTESNPKPSDPQED